jgi:V8-like Glu-specific endopeptidase
MRGLILFSALGILVSGKMAFAIPRITANTFQEKISERFTANHNFEGIVALSNCSGSLVQFETSKDSDRAMVLTNGHCYEKGFPPPGQYVYGVLSNRRFQVLDRNARTIGTVMADLVMYSSMTKTDMTLYRLTETIGEIKRKYGFSPLTMSSRHPDINQPIEVISGYWRRGFVCNIEAFIYQLKEGGWLNEDSIRYSRPGCEVYGGTSGSPIVAYGTRTVIGINNTGNESGQRCTENNPCEIDQRGNVSFVKGYSYGQQTYWVTTCLNPNLDLDLRVAGCMLFH